MRPLWSVSSPAGWIQTESSATAPAEPGGLMRAHGCLVT